MNDKSLGAIASVETAEIYGLKVLEANINKNTRPPKICDKIYVISLSPIYPCSSSASSTVYPAFCSASANKPEPSTKVPENVPS